MIKGPPGARSMGWAEALVALTLLVPPLLIAFHLPAGSSFGRLIDEPFRLPKLLASEILGLTSLLVLAPRLRRVANVSPSLFGRWPAFWAVAPILVLASLSALTTLHPHHVRSGLWSLWVGAICLLGWSLVGGAMRRLLELLLIPAFVLALLGVLQYHGIWRPFAFEGAEEARRLGITSLAGSVGDLGSYLVLPGLIAQVALFRLVKGVLSRRKRRPRSWLRPSLYLAALLMCLYGLAVTQTLVAVAALGAASLLLWWMVLDRRRRLWVGAAALVAVFAFLVPGGMRSRLSSGLELARKGELNELLSGRLDGWQAGVWMLQQRPLRGVGHGAYRAEFSDAKLALARAGLEPYLGHRRTSLSFANAHNEYVEVAAELGLPGMAALVWGLGVVFICLRRRSRSAAAPAERLDVALAWSGVLALAILSVGYFPLRLALTGYPAVAFLSWILGGPSQEQAG